MGLTDALTGGTGLRGAGFSAAWVVILALAVLAAALVGAEALAGRASGGTADWEAALLALGAFVTTAAARFTLTFACGAHGGLADDEAAEVAGSALAA